MRWAQYGASHGAHALPRVGLSVGTDLSDPKSPCGDVHIRNKTAVGRRTALAALHVGYNASFAGSGPLVKGITVQAGVVEIAFDAPDLELRAINQTVAGASNFELTSDPSLKTAWTPATASLGAGPGVVSVSIFAMKALSAIAGVRYAWAGVPDGPFLYGADGGLPAGPFIARCTGVQCTLVPPGHLPTE